jgi:hypothetical protein
MSCNNPQDFHGFSFRNLGVPALELAMVSARVRVYTHYPAGFIDDFLCSAVNPESRMRRIPVSPIVNVYETFAVNQPSQPSDLEWVFVLQGKWLRALAEGFGS